MILAYNMKFENKNQQRLNFDQKKFFLRNKKEAWVQTYLYDVKQAIIKLQIGLKVHENSNGSECF